MNTILTPSAPLKQCKGRVLLIEPDSSRATMLQTILRRHGGIDLELVESVSHAVRSLAEQVPDLVLTSTFLPPGDETLLTAQLKRTPSAAHVQIVALPYSIDLEGGFASEASRASLAQFLRKRLSRWSTRDEVQTLPEQLEEYLSQARRMRDDLWYRHLLSEQRAPERPAAPPPQPTAPLISPAETMPKPAPGLARSDRRRARRRRAAEVPELRAVRLAGCTSVAVVDISSGGVLIETMSKLDPGAIDVELLGRDANMSVPAQLLRSQVAAVDSMGVRYHVALMFGRELQLFSPRPSSALPEDLARVLTRTLREADRRSPTAVRIRFERELRRLLPVRDILIRQAPVIAERGIESVYFTVPWGSGQQPVLQAIFDRDYSPTAMEFRLLKAAASLAAVVLEFAPLGSPRALPPALRFDTE